MNVLIWKRRDEIIWGYESCSIYSTMPIPGHVMVPAECHAHSKYAMVCFTTNGEVKAL